MDLTHDKIQSALENHEKWLSDPDKGDKLHFSNLDLWGYDFANSKLSDAAFTNCNLQACSFQGADLTRADLFSSDLTAADMSGAI